MSTHWSTTRKHGAQPPASVTVSRLIVLVFVVAILLGATTGVIWIGWNLLRNQFAG